jgi:chloride channel 3/4/5
MIGVFTAIVAFLVDVSEATINDYKTGYCSTNAFSTREACCITGVPGFNLTEEPIGEDCQAWKSWSRDYWGAFGIYVGFALAFGVISGAVTMTTRANLPAASQEEVDEHTGGGQGTLVKGKTMYMAAGSGIPEIKTILSGFVIPHFLDLKVLIVKAVGATFAVATGMCLGKEGPFVHISTCAGWLVASLFPKYSENGRKMREMLSVACSAGLSVAFGAPIGGVLFSYEASNYLRFFDPTDHFWTGNQHLLSTQSLVARVSLLADRRRRTQSSKSHGHRKTCIIRSESRRFILQIFRSFKIFFLMLIIYPS